MRFRWKKRERSRACGEVHRNWWAVLDSNQRPPDQKAGANAVTLCFSSVHCDSYAILLLHRKSGPNSELRYIAFHWRSYARLTTVPVLYLAGGGDLPADGPATTSQISPIDNVLTRPDDASSLAGHQRASAVDAGRKCRHLCYDLWVQNDRGRPDGSGRCIQRTGSPAALR